MTKAIRLRQTETGQERYIRVRQSYYTYTLRDQSPYSGCRTVPAIRIRGHWLRKAGFEADMPVKIEVSDGCLVLRVEQGEAGA